MLFLVGLCIRVVGSSRRCCRCVPVCTENVHLLCACYADSVEKVTLSKRQKCHFEEEIDNEEKKKTTTTTTTQRETKNRKRTRVYQQRNEAAIGVSELLSCLVGPTWYSQRINIPTNNNSSSKRRYRCHNLQHACTALQGRAPSVESGRSSEDFGLLCYCFYCCTTANVDSAANAAAGDSVRARRRGPLLRHQQQQQQQIQRQHHVVVDSLSPRMITSLTYLRRSLSFLFTPPLSFLPLFFPRLTRSKFGLKQRRRTRLVCVPFVLREQLRLQALMSAPRVDPGS